MLLGYFVARNAEGIGDEDGLWLGVAVISDTCPRPQVASLFTSGLEEIILLNLRIKHHIL
jgi:hypothetical protein